MEHVNNDMDDLFRKAGEQYPLKTSGSDWDAVLGKLREDSGSMTNDETGSSKRRRWGWLFLLIPLTLGSVMYFSSGHKKSDHFSAVNTKNNVLPEKDAATVRPNEANIKTETEKPVPQNTNASENIKAGTDQTTSDGLSLNRVQSEKHATTSESAGSASNSGMSGSHGNSANRPGTGRSNSLKLVPLTASAGGSVTSTTATGKSDGNRPGQSNTAGITQSSGYTAETATAGTVALMATAPPASTGSADVVQKNKVSAADSHSTKAKDSSINTAAAKKEKSTATESRGFYFGLFAGPNWNTIKFQTVEQAGVDIGILMGYRFNKRIAVESGFILDKSYYYSKGEYFNPSKTGLPSNEKVVDVTASCIMFEIPVTFRYDFSIGKNHGFFANAGLSSYFMKKENYSANLVAMGGVPWTYPDTTYINSTNNLFSVVQLSAGYERTIGQKTKIRVEPYVKIPLQGLGIGKMPISSAGIYFGITYSLK